MATDDVSLFRKELESLINRYSKENGSDTPDFILAKLLMDFLEVFDCATRARTLWYDVPKVSAEPESYGGDIDLCGPALGRSPDVEAH